MLLNCLHVSGLIISVYITLHNLYMVSLERGTFAIGIIVILYLVIWLVKLIRGYLIRN